MEVNTTWQGNVLVASLKGEISMMNHASLAARLEELAKTGAKGLILNFAEVVYIASVGIGLLLKLVKDGKERGVDVRLAAARPAIKMVLEMVRVDSIVPMDISVDEALAHMAPATVSA